MSLRVGDRVRIERDEKIWPPKGTWKRYAGKPGVVVSVVQHDHAEGGTEVGVAVGVTSLPRRPDGRGLMVGDHPVAWFLPHELTAAGARRLGEGPVLALSQPPAAIAGECTPETAERHTAGVRS